ncbi:hypothetical protein EVAR_37231_1 [Eumeta japonica]|uniref:Uncharacterized protein n=1 Tax=Eumeta variegata TaxID=151549 RepID=A0A4C1Y5G1_EUMVA|nr:hypothetical protein EVAR_37231_1 [Eumeta japonica]
MRLASQSKAAAVAERSKRRFETKRESGSIPDRRTLEDIYSTSDASHRRVYFNPRVDAKAQRAPLTTCSGNVTAARAPGLDAFANSRLSLFWLTFVDPAAANHHAELPRLAAVPPPAAVDVAGPRSVPSRTGPGQRSGLRPTGRLDAGGERRSPGCSAPATIEHAPSTVIDKRRR